VVVGAAWAEVMKPRATLHPSALAIAMAFWLATFIGLRALGLAPWQALAGLALVAGAEVTWGVRAT